MEQLGISPTLRLSNLPAQEVAMISFQIIRFARTFARDRCPIMKHASDAVSFMVQQVLADARAHLSMNRRPSHVLPTESRILQKLVGVPLSGMVIPTPAMLIPRTPANAVAAARLPAASPHALCGAVAPLVRYPAPLRRRNKMSVRHDGNFQQGSGSLSKVAIVACKQPHAGDIRSRS